MNGRFGGNYLHETSLMAAARTHGYNVVSIGKTGPTGIQDLTTLGSPDALLIDDVHFLARKKATQEELLHTLDALEAWLPTLTDKGFVLWPLSAAVALRNRIDLTASV